MNILIIAEYMAPTQAIASIRWTKLGKYLATDNGCNVDILTNGKIYENQVSGNELYKFDETISDDIRHFGNIYKIPGTLFSRSVIRALNTVKVVQKHRTERKHANTEESRQPEQAVLGKSDLASSLGDAYSRLKESGYLASFEKAHVPWKKYDVIISTYGPKWTHLVAEQVKRKNPQCVWIADYRDVVIDAHSNINTVNKTFAETHTASADCIFTVAKDVIRQLYLPEGQRVEVVYNGFDPEEKKARKRTQNNKFILAYTGTLYNDPPNVRDITPVFEALSDLIEDGSIKKEDVLVAYCGTTEDVFLSQAEPYSNVPIENLGLLSRREAQRLQDRASVLIFSTWNTETSRGALSGKLYEYMSSGVPIVSLCAGDVPEAEPSEVIRKAQVGFAFDEVERAAHYPLLVDYIYAKYREWKTTGMTTQEPNATFIESFEHQSVARRVYDIIDELRNVPKQDVLRASNNHKPYGQSMSR